VQEIFVINGITISGSGKMDFHHISVMAQEVLKVLEVKENGIYLDCTLGGGGHSRRIGSLLSCEGFLIGIDRDEDALNAAKKNLSDLACKVELVHGNFSDLEKILSGLGVEKIDGAVFDLGVSSHQIDTAERGFSYMQNAKLDMRMDRSQKLTAFEVVNTYSEEKLAKIFHDFGEERFSKKIASVICEVRKNSAIETTGELVKLIEKNIPHTKNGGHPAKRIFQAIRIEVNNELGILESSVTAAVKNLKLGGKIAVITFHSLEDRLIKNTFKNLAQGCICPKNFPVCVCGHKPEIKILGKAITATAEEIENNPRSKSAKLRAAEKII